jgi:thioredoxin reductase (NADPH)
MADIVLYGAEYCPACFMAKDYLNRRDILFVYKDISSDDKAVDEFLQVTNTKTIPLLLIKEDGKEINKVVGFKRSDYELIFNK